MKRIATLIFVAIACIATPAPAADAPAADPHAQLDQILKRPMFQAWRLRQEGSGNGPDIELSNGANHFLKRLGDSIQAFWDWLFDSKKKPNPVANRSSGSVLPTILKIGGWTVLAIGLLFFAFVIYRILRQPAANYSMGKMLSRHQISEALESGDALALGSAEWMEEARRLAAEQNFRAVYRALYLALLSGLHTAGKIEHNRNRTNWTYVQHYRGPTPERETFGSLTDLFDRVWYGRKDATGVNIEALHAQVASLTRGDTA